MKRGDIRKQRTENASGGRVCAGQGAAVKSATRRSKVSGHKQENGTFHHDLHKCREHLAWALLPLQRHLKQRARSHVCLQLCNSSLAIHSSVSDARPPSLPPLHRLTTHKPTQHHTPTQEKEKNEAAMSWTHVRFETSVVSKSGTEEGREGWRGGEAKSWG